MPMFGVSDLRDLSPMNPPLEQTLTAIDVAGMYPSDDSNFRRGGHGLFSTTSDYLKFATMLLDGKTATGRSFCLAPCSR